MCQVSRGLRKRIFCKYASRPGGCTKVHCFYFHVSKRKASEDVKHRKKIVKKDAIKPSNELSRREHSVKKQASKDTSSIAVRPTFASFLEAPVETKVSNDTSGRKDKTPSEIMQAKVERLTKNKDDNNFETFDLMDEILDYEFDPEMDLKC